MTISSSPQNLDGLLSLLGFLKYTENSGARDRSKGYEPVKTCVADSCVMAMHNGPGEGRRDKAMFMYSVHLDVLLATSFQG